MRYILLIFLVNAALSFSYGQKQEPVKGPVFSDFGQVYPVEKPDLLLDPEKSYKVIFDIYTDEKKPSVMNPLLNTVARFMNMHAQTGLPVENMDIVVVLHGPATKNALSEAAFKRNYRHNHPNISLIDALDEKGVQLYVCGQSLKSKGYGAEDVSEHVKISLSALTALVKYQSEGYRLINFN